MLRKLIVAVLIAQFICVISLEVTNFKTCPSHHTNETTVNLCTINEVRSTCERDESRDGVCVIQLDRNFTFQVDFTPEFNADTLTNYLKVYFPNGLIQHLKINNVCSYTKCPTIENIKQTYAITTLLSSTKYLKGYFDIKFVLTGSGNEDCCFTANIKTISGITGLVANTINENIVYDEN